MRILLINFHYFRQGGPDTYFFNIKRSLEQAGHLVVPFSFDYEETLPTQYRHYFPEPLTGCGPSQLANHRMSAAKNVRAIVRMFSNREVDRKFRSIMRDESPDIVYSIYLSSSFLPNILRIARREFNVPVAYRLSDFHMFCPSYLFFRDGKVCRECEQNMWAAVRHQCMHGSALASLLRILQMRYVRLRNWYDEIDVFLCPSKWMQRYLREHEIPTQKVLHLPTFSRDLAKTMSKQHVEAPYILCLGRIVEEKGVEVLLRAYNQIPSPACRLLLVGQVSAEYREHLLCLVDDEHRLTIEIDGPRHGASLEQIITGCQFLVQPALCYENMPNTVLEAMSAGKAIIASDIGSLPELVENSRNGLLVAPGDVKALTEAMKRMMHGGKEVEEMGINARRSFEDHYTEEVHLECLLRIFGDLTRHGNIISEG